MSVFRFGQYFQLNKLWFLVLILLSGLVLAPVYARDLAEIKADGVLRHIGVPYANFVIQYTEGKKIVHTGFDVELIQNFAQYLGVRYEFINASWNNTLSLLTGRDIQLINDKVVKGKTTPIKGDIIAHGFTILPWREETVSFSDDYFPSSVWLIARNNSAILPIKPSGSITQDINSVKKMMNQRDVMAMKNSCLDPNLYNLYATGANIILPHNRVKINEMVPAILSYAAEMTLLDVPDTLIALGKWPGEIKVIGPISDIQKMAAAFRNESPQLRQAFNEYLKIIKANGTYIKLVNKYYPSVFHYYKNYFELT